MSLSDRPSSEIDPAVRPRPFAQRVQLLLILVVLPVCAVTLPALFVTGVFGQRPRPKLPAHVKPTPPPDTSGLSEALNHSAESLLPIPAPLTPDTIRVTVRADHLAARAEKVISQARQLGGSAIEGVPTAGEKHLFVDVPAGCADAFRAAVTTNDPPVVPSVSPSLNAAHDQLEVVIRPAADDE